MSSVVSRRSRLRGASGGTLTSHRLRDCGDGSASLPRPGSKVSCADGGVDSGACGPTAEDDSAGACGDRCVHYRGVGLFAAVALAAESRGAVSAQLVTDNHSLSISTQSCAPQVAAISSVHVQVSQGDRLAVRGLDRSSDVRPVLPSVDSWADGGEVLGAPNSGVGLDSGGEPLADDTPALGSGDDRGVVGVGARGVPDGEHVPSASGGLMCARCGGSCAGSPWRLSPMGSVVCRSCRSGRLMPPDLIPAFYVTGVGFLLGLVIAAFAKVAK